MKKNLRLEYGKVFIFLNISYLMKKLVSIIACVLVINGCSTKPIKPTIGENEVLLYIHPVNCVPTKWESDYSRNPDHYPNLKPEDELGILKTYYKRVGADILNLEKKTMFGLKPCEECECPRGYEIDIRIEKKYSIMFINDGFKYIKGGGGGGLPGE